MTANGSRKVSIITACKNSGKTLEDSIQSVLNQTYPEIEYIVIDGDSQDRSKEILSHYQDRISKIESSQDSGIYDAFNKGLRLATGNWILFLGADDFLLPNASKVFQELSNYTDYDCVYSDVEYLGTGRFNSRLDWATLISNRLHHQGAIYQRKCFQEFKYNSNYKICGDYELNLKLFLEKKPVKKLSTIFVQCSPGGVSHNNKMRARKEIESIRSSYVPHDWIYRWTARSIYFVVDFKRSISF